MKTILHSDCNNFYASVECVYDPTLRDKPVAVCGDPAERHGIILAKNELAKKRGIKTGETIGSAREKCPELTLLPPCGERYVRFSRILRDMYAEYSSQVEPFGLDESWLAIDGGPQEGMELASTLRRRAREKLGITLSIGVSFNKIFAKLGSDMHKPDATTVISTENFREKVWPLPVGELLFIGRSAAQKLNAYGLRTIGDIARANQAALHDILGKNGDTLYDYAAGRDAAPVLALDQADDIKSVGNSTTPAFDIADSLDAQRVVYMLCDSVAERMRKQRVRCTTVTVWLRKTDLSGSTHQMKLPRPTDLSLELSLAALRLLRQVWTGQPLRSLGVQGSGLIFEDDRRIQLSTLPDPPAQRAVLLEKTADQLHGRFGKSALFRAILLTGDQRKALQYAADSSLSAANMAAIHRREM